MEFIFTDGQNTDFAALCDLLDESLDKLAGHVIDRSKYRQYNTLEKIHDVVLAYDGALPVACAGFRQYSKGVAEVKRVFVREEYRGQGISKQLMARIENRAAEKGYTALILETGAPLLAANSLYKKLGYRIIDNYGPYKGMVHSVCMKKGLEAPASGEPAEIREAAEADLAGLLRLYAQFKSVPVDETDYKASDIWRDILSDRKHHVIVLTLANQVVSSCVLVIVPNLTHGGRPYALIENVVTDEKHRGKGYATAVLNYARDIALRENCYKIMLLTGSRLESTLRFYERAGYNRNDKTAFIQWL